VGGQQPGCRVDQPPVHASQLQRAAPGVQIRAHHVVQHQPRAGRVQPVVSHQAESHQVLAQRVGPAIRSQQPKHVQRDVDVLGEDRKVQVALPVVGVEHGQAAVGGQAPQIRRTEDIIVDWALGHLDAAASRDARLADAHDPITGHVRHLRGAVTPREAYGLVHGELGPDHILVTPAGEPVMIDFGGLTYFDVEWDHAWLQMRFGHTYPALRPVDLDPHRLALYRYAQVLSLIEGPLRIADTDFPDRQWMLDLAEHNITKALAAL
jgi:hypothetical protein